MTMRRVYLDNAATSYPKPPSVPEAMWRAMVEWGAPAGRGAYAEAMLVEREIAVTRGAIADLLDFDHRDRVIFTASGTDSLHLALGGLLRPSDHVVTSEAEHNSVLRPLHQMRRTHSLTVTIVPCDATGRVDPDDVAVALAARPTRLVAITQASNVTGAVQPVEAIVAAAHRAGALVLLDACQTVGHIPVSMRSLGVDVLAASGHKGLLGPLGTGVLLLGERAAREIQPVRPGGTGSRSDEADQPEAFPDRLEAGNLNVPGVVGLGAGVAYLREQGIATLATRAEQQVRHLADSWRDVPGVRALPPWDEVPTNPTISKSPDRVGLLSIALDSYDPREAAAILDASFRVQVRAGLHCAPRIHGRLGTAAGGGTLRFSVGPFTTDEDITVASDAVAALVGAVH